MTLRDTIISLVYEVFTHQHFCWQMSWGQAFIKTCENYTRLHSCFKPRPPAGSFGRCPLQYLLSSTILKSGLAIPSYPHLPSSQPKFEEQAAEITTILNLACAALLLILIRNLLKRMTGLEPAPVALIVRSSNLAELHSSYFSNDLF